MISNQIRDFMIETKCSSAWLSKKTGISARHLFRLKMHPDKYPLGASTATKFQRFLAEHNGQPVPTAAEVSEEARSKHGELCKEMWRDPEFRAKQMRSRRTRKARKRQSEAAKKAWKKRKGE